MRKFLLFFSLLLFFTSCKNSDEFNIKKVDAPKDYELFESIESNLDTLNAGTSSYIGDMKYGFLLDITKESDYEKYFPRYSMTAYVLSDDNFTKYESYKMAAEFLRKGSSLQEAYRLISYYYVNRDKLNIFDFNQYVLPYNTEFQPEEQDKVYAEYVLQTEAVRRINLSLLKARNSIKYALENNIKENKKDEQAMAHLMIAVSYLAQDRLYQLENIKKHAALWKELGGKDVDFLGSKENGPLTELLTYIAYNDNIGVAKLLIDGLNKGFLHTVLSPGGLFNYLNDDFYMPCGMAVRNDKYAVNPFYERYGDYKKTTAVLKRLISGESENEEESYVNYNITNNLDRLYDNPVYILALNGVVYTVEMQGGIPYKVEYRNPLFFDVSYINPFQHSSEEGSVFPNILSEYNISFKQTLFLVNDNNTYKKAWKGNISNEQPIKNNLFKFKGVIDCLDKSILDTVFLCGYRENMIMIKDIYETKCSGKVDCTLSADDIIYLSH